MWFEKQPPQNDKYWYMKKSQIGTLISKTHATFMVIICVSKSALNTYGFKKQYVFIIQYSYT